MKFEEKFILLLSSFLSKIEENDFYYDIIKQNEFNIKISIFERLYNVYYLLFKKCSKKYPNLKYFLIVHLFITIKPYFL